jgi:type II secretory pathway pseudopilin PulG
MSVDERDRRAAGGREGVQRAPRSGGRTTEQRSTGKAARTSVAAATADASGGGARGARRHPTQGSAALKTQGSAALKLDAAQPLRVTEPDAAPRLRVAPPAPISVPRAPFVALVLSLVVAGVFGILLINTKTNENSFEISQLQEQQHVLDNQQQQLQKQIDMYETPGNLHAAARKLGLVIGQPALIRLQDGRIINPMIPGTGETALTAQDTTTVQDTAKTQDGATVPGQGTAQNTGNTGNPGTPHSTGTASDTGAAGDAGVAQDAGR